MDENPVTPARTRTLRKSSYVPDEIQQARFVDLLRDGIRRDEAARAVGSTSKRMRSLQRRDEAFDMLVQDAEAKGKPEYQQWIRRTLDGIAGNTRHPQQLRAAIVLAEAHLPEFEHKRTTRIGNAPGEELAIGANARISAETLANLPQEMLEKLLEAKRIERMLERGEIPPLRAIEGGEP